MDVMSLYQLVSGSKRPEWTACCVIVGNKFSSLNWNDLFFCHLTESSSYGANELAEAQEAYRVNHRATVLLQLRPFTSRKGFTHSSIPDLRAEPSCPSTRWGWTSFWTETSFWRSASLLRFAATRKKCFSLATLLRNSSSIDLCRWIRHFNR